MKILWTFIRWFLGLIFCLGSIGGFASGEFWQALFSLGLGLLLLPTVTKALSKKPTDNNEQSFLNTQIQPQAHKTTTQQSNSSQSSDKLVNITTKSVGNNTTEMTIELNEDVFLKKLKDGTLGSGKREIDIEDITGFYGRKQYSPNRQYCVSYADGHYENDKWKNGDIALVKDKKLLFKKKLQRPNDCFVSNDGIVIACDWLNSDALTGKFLIFNETGEELFSKKTTANLGNCAISDNSQIALFETHNSDTNDGDKIFIVDIANKQIIKKFERPASFNSAIIDTENKRIKLKDHFGFATNKIIDKHSNYNTKMKKVTGIGGIFFKCKDPKRIKEWYKTHLGFDTDQWGTNFEWRQGGDTTKKGFTQWSPFSETTKHFEPSTREFMINYRVENLEALVEQLKKEGVTITDKIEAFEYGKFVHIIDIEGNKVELWEPNDIEYDKIVEGRTK